MERRYKVAAIATLAAIVAGSIPFLLIWTWKILGDWLGDTALAVGWDDIVLQEVFRVAGPLIVLTLAGAAITVVLVYSRKSESD